MKQSQAGENRFLSFVYRLADRNRQSPQALLRALVGLAILMVIALGGIAVMTRNLNAYAGTPVAASGRLEKVRAWYHEALQIRVDGNSYVISKASQFSKRAFGFAGERKLFELGDILDSEIGGEVWLEYVQVGREAVVVALAVNGVEYISEAGAVHDLIGQERTIRNVYAAGLCLLILLFVLAWRGVIR